jgi:hypothetical protein
MNLLTTTKHLSTRVLAVVVVVVVALTSAPRGS